MTTPNHIAGGIVFTGLFCSLWNVNIFENPISISTVVLCSILPDIDHRKSIIGKVFFPISKYLQKHYGHRTITHSLLALIIISIIALIIQRLLALELNLLLIVFFSYLSHIILDMITLQGVAFLSPFYKNPCVIPGNPDLRFRTGNTKQEGIIFFVLAFSTFFMQPLFANGFWSSYNKSFDSIEHVYREFKNNPNAIKVHYKYKHFNAVKEDTASVIKADKNRLILLDNTYHSIDNSTNFKIEKLQIINTTKKLLLETIEINSITPDSLNQLLKNKYINRLEIVSTENIILESQDKIKKGNYFEITETHNIRATEEENKPIKQDHSAEIKHLQRQEQIRDRINQIQAEITAERLKISQSKNQLAELKASKQTIEKQITQEQDGYILQKYKSELIQINDQIKEFRVYQSSKINSKIIALKNAKSEIKPYIATTEEKTPTLISGIVEHLKIE